MDDSLAADEVDEHEEADETGDEADDRHESVEQVHEWLLTEVETGLSSPEAYYYAPELA